VPFNDLQVPSLESDLQRVKILLLNTIEAYRSGAFTTREELLQTYAEVIKTYENTLKASLYEHLDAVPDTEPSIQWRNQLAAGINQDLVLLFFEMNQLALLMSGLFNQQVSEADDLVGRIKRIKSKVGDYQLITGEGGISIGESFLNTDNVAVGSDLISTEEAEISTVEGAVTAKEAESEVLEVESIIIDSANSNGILGNNEETGAADLHNNLEDIVDGNPDTWAEYENVVFQDEITEALNLRLILKLSEQRIVNRIDIDPVNFGQLNNVSISDIRISADGESWVSIVGDLPLADYLGETAGNTLVLSPTSSRFSGKFSYTFLPRKVTHLSIDLRQDTGFLISTVNGPKTRFVIGVKSIDVSSVKFASASQLVSSTLDASSAIKKLALLAAYRPISSDLGSIAFHVSFDGGTTWTDIQPLTEDDMSAPEVLSIDQITDNFLYKLTFTRNDEAFADLDDFDETGDNNTVTIFEARSISTEISPSVVTPNKQMANNDVVVMNAPIGSRSLRRRPGLPRFLLGEGTGDALVAQLPFDLYPDTDIRRDDVEVYVAGRKWTQISGAAALAAAASSDRVYYINDENEVIFGDGDPVNVIGTGRSPRAGARITVSLPPEELHFAETEGGYQASVDLASSGNKNATRLRRVGPLSNYVSEVLAEGVERIELAHRNIDSDSFSVTERDDTGTAVAGSFITEVANRTLLTAPGEYYVDYRRGIIYLYSTASDVTTTAVYKYYPHSTIDDYEWRRDGDGRFAGVFISDTNILIDSWTDTTGADRDGYTFNLGEVTDQVPGLSGKVSSSSARVIELSHKQVVAGSLSLEVDVFGSSITAQEVTFVDGYSELQRVSATTEEELAPITGSGNQTIQLAGGPNIVAKNGVQFSNTAIFATEVSGTPSVAGEYSINFTTGIVTVNLASDMPGDIIASYYVFSTSASSDGRYSVDYKNGLIYCANKPQDGYTISYNYTKYRVSYPVARALGSDEFDINVEKNTITINTEELNSGDIQIAYQFNSVTDATLSELVEYYTPLVRDLRWRLLIEEI
jgi:hypothetical protein